MSVKCKNNVDLFFEQNISNIEKLQCNFSKKLVEAALLKLQSKSFYLDFLMKNSTNGRIITSKIMNEHLVIDPIE